MTTAFIHKTNFPFWLITISVLALLIVPHTVQEGMFMDAVQYSSVAKNMSEGNGSFWFPKFTESWSKVGVNTFHEQPPLGFGIQAIFFKVLGTGIYVERIYSLLIALISSCLIFNIWKTTNKKNDTLSSTGWLPVLLWGTIPLVFWSFHNNILENTMGVFTLAAVLFALKGILTDKTKWPMFVLSGVFVFCATLTKGVPGLFPVVVVGCYWLVYRNFSFVKMIYQTLIVALTVFLLYLVIISLNSDAYTSLNFYLNERLLGRIGNEPTVGNRFWILYRLFIDLAPLIAVCFIILLLKKGKLNQGFQQTFFFLLLGFSASAPLMLTLVQKGFYFVPSLPFFALGFSVIIGSVLSVLTSKIKMKSNSFKMLSVVGILLVVSSLTYSFAQTGKTNQDHNILSDVKLLGKEIPHDTTIQTESYILNEHWILQAYLMRYYNISLGTSQQQNGYFLTDKELANETYSLLPLHLKKYRLYQVKTTGKKSLQE